MSNGLLIVVSGFSGAGKGTLVKKLLRKYPNYVLSVSATTRSPREGEKDGIEYFFKTEEEFKLMIDAGELIEYEGYVGHYYGTPKQYIERMRESGKDVVLEIDVRGGLSIKAIYDETVLVFVSAPSISETKRRLCERGTEESEDVEKRMMQIEREIELIPRYDYLLINDDLDKCVEKLNSIVLAEKQKVSNSTYMIDNLKKELNGGEK